MKHFPRKRWGQHFLTDTNLLYKLVRLIDPEPHDSILEIGPGEGALTELLAPMVNELVAIEIDRNLFHALKTNTTLSECRILNQDFLRVDLGSLPFTGESIRVVGNIPYRVTSPIIFKLLEDPSRWQDIHLMVQKEVADRLTAPAGNKTYGRLTVMVQAFMDVRQLLDVPPEVFVPRPAVRSAVVHMAPHDRYSVEEGTLQTFREIVRAAFSQRRKMLKNSLGAILSGRVGEVDFDLSRRPEMLTVGEFICLAGNLSKCPR